MDLLFPLRIIGYGLLVLLPGAWVTFGLPLRGLPYHVKLLLGVTLAPFVIAIQFYAIRLTGVSFGWTTILLVLANLPPLFWIVREYSRPPPLERRTLAALIIVVLIILTCLAPFLVDSQKRVYSWEAWSQADVVYSLANGNLLLEDADLAGVTLSYPWAGHVYQAVTSYMLGTAPASNYIWLNLVWLAVIFGLAAAIVRELGGNQLSQVMTVVWLSFGVNVVGYVSARVIPTAWSDAHHVLRYLEGDNRYTPWLDKAFFFGQMYFAMGLFIAIAYLTIRHWPTGSRRHYLALTSAMLCGLGVIYPVLLPPAFAIVGGRAVVLFAHQVQERKLIEWRQFLAITVALTLTAFVTWLQVKFLTQTRDSSGLIALNDRLTVRYEALITAVVMSPLLVGFALFFIRNWRAKLDAMLVLGLGAAASCALYVLFDIPWWRNEYKFIFTAAILLAPFPALALEPLLGRLGRLTLPAVAIVGLILAAPLLYKMYGTGQAGYFVLGPPVDTSHFDMRLDDGESLSGLLSAIENKTPVDSLVVLENTDLHFPTLIRRHLYVAPEDPTRQPGILTTSDEMLFLVKGYPHDLVAARRATVTSLFDSDDAQLMAASLEQILQAGRPVTLILDQQRQAGLIAWLDQERIGTRLYEANGAVLWLVAPH